MLLKTLEGLFYKTKLVCGLYSIFSRYQRIESWYVDENKAENCFFEQSWYVV
jgi:hypothetical protein